MEESKILAQFNTKTEPYVEPVGETAITPDIDVQVKMDLYTQLGIDMTLLGDKDTSDRVGDIYEWAKSVNPNADSLGVAMMIQELISKIGRTDKSSLENIWDYITIDREMRLLSQRKRNLCQGY